MGLSDAITNGSASKNAKSWSASHQGRFKNLFQTGFLSDLKISVGDKIYKVHKIFIATGSPKLYQEVEEKSVSGIFYVDECVQPDAFYTFLKFLYTGSCDLKAEDSHLTIPILQLARKYGVLDLSDKCESLLNEELREETVVNTYQQAIHFQEQELGDKALNYISRNAWNIMESNEFLTLSLENLKRILACDQIMLLNESQLLRCLFRWNKIRNLKQGSSDGIDEELLGYINWEFVDPEKFEEPDVIELEKLFRMNYTPLLSSSPNMKRICKKGRRYFEDDESSFIAFSRLPQKFAYCTDNNNDQPEVIRFKTDVSICLLSIGIPTYSQSGVDDFDVKIEIWDEQTNVKRVVHQKHAPHSKELYRLRFKRPLKVKADCWYSISGTIKGTPGYGNMGGKSVNHVKCTNAQGKEILAKFEFKSGNSPERDINSGQIDEFLFKLVDDY